MTIDSNYQIIPKMEFYFTLKERSLILIMYLLSVDFHEQAPPQMNIIIQATVEHHHVLRFRNVYGGQVITGYAYDILEPGDYDATLSIKTSSSPLNITIVQRHFNIITFKKTSET